VAGLEKEEEEEEELYVLYERNRNLSHVNI